MEENARRVRRARLEEIVAAIEENPDLGAELLAALEPARQRWRLRNGAPQQAFEEWKANQP